MRPLSTRTLRGFVVLLATGCSAAHGELTDDVPLPTPAVTRTVPLTGVDRGICPELPAEGARRLSVTIPARTGGVIRLLDAGPGRDHQLWVNRRLHRDIQITLEELPGNMVEVQVTPEPQEMPGYQWGFLLLDYSGCTFDEGEERIVVGTIEGRMFRERHGMTAVTSDRAGGYLHGASTYTIGVP